MNSFDLKKYILHMPSQYSIGCCTSFASMLAAEIFLTARGENIRFSRLYTYYMSRELQGRTGRNGAELKGTLESMRSHGVLLDSLWPFSVHRVNVKPPLHIVTRAAERAVISYDVATVSNFKEYLHRNIPVIVGMHTGRMFWKLKGPLASQVYKPIDSTDNRDCRGHAFTVIGYDDTIMNGSWIIANSLGPAWGDYGYGVVPYECYVDIGEAYVITEFR